MAQFKKGNKAAEKWTEENALQLLKDALNTLKKDEEIVFIGQLAAKQDTYSDIYTYIVNKFGEENPVFRTLKARIDEICKTRLFMGGLNNEFNSTICKLGLMTNHGMTEKSEQKTELSGNINVDPFKQIRENSDVQETDSETKDSD